MATDKDCGAHDSFSDGGMPNGPMQGGAYYTGPAVSVRATPGWTNSKMNPWVPDNNPHQARRIGKTAEEVNELGSVLARISIQGIEAIDPSSGKTNRQRLLDETADVMAQCECNMYSIFTREERAYVHERALVKRRQMAEWEEHYK